jgi:hypothetical protein
MVIPNNRMFSSSQNDDSVPKESCSSDISTKNSSNSKLINSRKDIVKILNEICRWYKEHEPSSPIIFILESCVKMVGKDIFEMSEILHDFMYDISCMTNIGLRCKVDNKRATAESEANAPINNTTENRNSLLDFFGEKTEKSTQNKKQNEINQTGGNNNSDGSNNSGISISAK